MFLFSKKKEISHKELEQIEEELLLADVGLEATNLIIEKIKLLLKKNPINNLQQAVIDILKEDTHKLNVPAFKYINDHTPYVILTIGTNGAGKTSTIGKISNLIKHSYNIKKILLVPCDTFRSGAFEQLKKISEVAKVDFFNDASASPSTIAYKALEHAKKYSYDVVIIDTSGRLENNTNLMEELQKLNTTIQKFSPYYPNESLLIVDGTQGQSSVKQALGFRKYIGISGLIITKSDLMYTSGTILNIMQQLILPTYFSTFGESIDNIKEFSLEKYINNLIRENNE